MGLIFQEGIYIDTNSDEAVKYHSLAADQNDLISLFNLQYLSDDIFESIKYYKKGADLGDPFFQLKYGCCCVLFNCGISFNECMKYIKLSAAKNIVQANFFLGILYYFKMGNINKAIEYFSYVSRYKEPKKPINDDFYNYIGNFSQPNKLLIFDYEMCSNTIAKFYSNIFLCEFYMREKTVHFDINKSIYHLSCISKQDIAKLQDFINESNLKYIPKFLIDYSKSILNDMMRALAEAYFDIAMFYMNDDIDKCIKYLKQTLDLNHDLAPFVLGMIYSYRKFNRINISKAIKYYSLAEKNIDLKNDCIISYFLVYPQYITSFYHNFIEENINIHKSLKYFALRSIGNSYYYGNFIQRDITKAIQFYKKASELGDSKAQYRLGRIYYEGKFVEQNIKKSIFYFNSSANAKNVDSQCCLGYIYYIGENVPKDIKNAIHYFIMAAENSSQIARFYLGIIYYKGTDVKQDMSLAIRFFKDAGNLNDSYAKINLGIIYKNGEGIKPNIVQSIEYFDEAIRFDKNEAARYNLAHIYFYSTEKQINKTIKLLIKPKLISIDYGFQLLCLVLIKECKPFSIENIQEVLLKIYKKCDKSIASKVYNEVISSELYYEDRYEELFEQIEQNELIYLDHMEFVLTKDLNKNKDKKDDTNEFAMNIDIDFYEGFGDESAIINYKKKNPNYNCNFNFTFKT